MLCRTKDDPSNGGVRSGAPTGGSAAEAADRAHAAEVHRFNDAMTERYGPGGSSRQDLPADFAEKMRADLQQ